MLVVIAGCLWELIALITHRLPTITSVIWALRDRRWGRFLVWLFLGWALEHFLGEGR